MSSFSIKRFNALINALDCKKYLEVGVNQGKTFEGIKAEAKTAVDPRFRFDTTARTQFTGERFYETTSDDFFININQDVYDFIFLDGLHTFEQTYRDFCNAAMVVAPKGIIVLDDSIPRDIYSAHTNPRVGSALRLKETELTRGEWQGDVYKTVFAIAEFFPLWSYRTITTGGNPQTVLWRKPRPVANRIATLEGVSRLDYFSFLENIDVLNPVDDYNTIIETIKQDYGVAG